MRPVLALLAVMLCCSVASAQTLTVAGSREYAPYEPIILAAEFDVPVGWTVLWDWDVERPARGIEVDGGRSVHVWTAPGTWEVELTAILARSNPDTGLIEFRKQEQIFDIVVTGAAPTPDKPPDTPDPLVGPRLAVTVYESLDQAPPSAAILARDPLLERQIESRIVDVDQLPAEAGHELSGIRSAISGKPLPLLVVLVGSEVTKVAAVPDSAESFIEEVTE